MRTTVVVSDDWQLALDDYVSYLRAGGLPESTCKLRHYQLRRFAASTGLAAFAATGDELVEYLASRDWSNSTRRSIRATLRSFYSWAAGSGRVERDPSQTLPKVPAVMGRPRPAADEVVTAGLEHADRRVRLMIELAAFAGLRCVEISRVHSDDLFQDFVGWSLRVIGKGDKPRTVPIPDHVARALRRFGPGWIFPGNVDGHLSPAYVSKLISRTLPGATAHQLRHRFASKAYQLGGRDIRAVQQLLGHASVATTQIYTAVDDDALRRAAAGAVGLSRIA